MKFRAVIRKDGTIATGATEGGQHLVSSVYKVMQIGGRTEAGEPLLVPLDEAVRPYHGVTVRMLRARINGGLLPAVRMGRAYLVAPADVSHSAHAEASRDADGEAKP